MPVTIRDVARAAGVSVATVSLVLNDAGQRLRIAQRTQAHVRACAEQLGYVADRRARSLRTAQAPTTILAALVTERVPDAFVVDIMRAIDEAAAQVGWETQFHLVRAGHDGAWDAVRSVAKACAGAIVVGHLEPGDSAWRRAIGGPAVHVGAGGQEDGAAVVRVDNRFAGDVVGRHLVALGHRRVAVLGPRRWRLPFVERLDGVRAALAEAGAPAPATLSQPDPDGETISWLIGARVTAVVCVYDRLALQLLKAARTAGVPVPGRWSVAGFDDMDWSALLTPALTTVHIPRQRLGRLAVERLQALLRNEPVPEPMVIRPELVVRESTGPVSDWGGPA